MAIIELFRTIGLPWLCSLHRSDDGRRVYLAARTEMDGPRQCESVYPSRADIDHDIRIIFHG